MTHPRVVTADATATIWYEWSRCLNTSVMVKILQWAVYLFSQILTTCQGAQKRIRARLRVGLRNSTLSIADPSVRRPARSRVDFKSRNTGRRSFRCLFHLDVQTLDKSRFSALM
jgi:hypothetical protein